MAKVLVVDDETVCCLSIQESLTESGHEVEAAFDGPQAVETAARFRPEVLVTDYLLRGDIDGLALAKTLRRTLPSLRIILMTGLAESDLEGKHDELGNVTVIRKPLMFEDIANEVHNLIVG